MSKIVDLNKKLHFQCFFSWDFFLRNKIEGIKRRKQTNALAEKLLSFVYFEIYEFFGFFAFSEWFNRRFTFWKLKWKISIWLGKWKKIDKEIVRWIEYSLSLTKHFPCKYATESAIKLTLCMQSRCNFL